MLTIEEMTKRLKTGPAITAKELRPFIEKARRSKEQGNDCYETKINSKGLPYDATVEMDLDDIEYRCDMGHYVSKEQVRYVVELAEQYREPAVKDDVTPVYRQPSIGNNPNPFIITGWTTSSGITIPSGSGVTFNPVPQNTAPYTYPCPYCSKPLDKNNNHDACVANLAPGP